MEDNTKLLFTEPETKIIEFEADVVASSGYCGLDCTGHCPNKSSCPGNT